MVYTPALGLIVIFFPSFAHDLMAQTAVTHARVSAHKDTLSEQHQFAALVTLQIRLDVRKVSAVPLTKHRTECPWAHQDLVYEMMETEEEY